MFKNYFGLKKPYNFAIALPFLIFFTYFLIIILVLGTFFIKNKTLFNPQTFYLLYLIVLAFIGILTVRFKLISYVFMVLITLEIFSGLGTYYLKEKKIVNLSFIPSVENIYKNIPNCGFEYHPLLVAVPKINSVSDCGKKKPTHNKDRLRGKNIDVKGKKLINVFGGSTTYDGGVRDDQTWPFLLNKFLGNRYAIANHGVPGYTTVEHVIQTSFYHTVQGKTPSCSIYYIGWNDIRNAHIEKLDPGYANFHLKSQSTNLGLLHDLNPPEMNSFSSLKNAFSFLKYLLIKDRINEMRVVKKAEDLVIGKTFQGEDEFLTKIFINNIKVIIGMNKIRNIKTVFIPQILNKFKLTSDNVYGWIPKIKDKDVIELLQIYNNHLKKIANQNGAYFIDIDASQFLNNDFVDQGHFNASGSEKFARLVYDKLDICY